MHLGSKQKIILMEGPDRTGKTNIAQELSRRIYVPYFKNSDEVRNFLDPKDYYVNILRYADPYFISYLRQTKNSVIIDRHYPSEWVYSRVFSRKTDMEALRRTDEAMASLDAKIIICFRNDYTDRHDDHFPEIITDNKLKLLHEGYAQFCSWTKCETHWINVDDENLDREVNEILDKAQLHLEPLKFTGKIDLEKESDSDE